MKACSWFAVAVIGLLAIIGGASPAAATGELGLSRDGVTWSAALPSPLFDPSLRWVPGDSESRSFYVRNQSGDDGVLDVTLLTGPIETLIDTGDLKVSAKVDSGAYAGANTAGPHLLIAAVPVAVGTVRKVTVKVDFDPASTDESQQLQLDLRFDVRLSQNTAVQPPTNPGNGGNGDNGGNGSGDLPSTGTVVTPVMFLLAVLLCASGTALIGFSRRRSTRLEERSSHVQA